MRMVYGVVVKTPKLSWLDIAERKSGAIRLTAAEAQPEPRNPRSIKAEVRRRWGIVPLVGMLEEAALYTGFPAPVASVSGGGSPSAEAPAERLLPVVYACGTLEVGRARKTIFVARYLRLRDLHREIAEGLNVMESANGANSERMDLWLSSTSGWRRRLAPPPDGT
ncbi:Tn3 family transposase [Streptomyces mobaraensis NBRC 13819 = DSM 40847]|nr:Tn3 family transposase [Streptomyces mobaraensis NBRC 13819 = DSM 40847]